MISQAGIYKLDLYENKEVVLTYDSNGDIDSITSSGDVLNFDTDNNSPELKNNLESGENNIIINDYEISFHIDSLSQENFDIIEKLQSSIYGYIPVFEFMDGQKYIINIPFKPVIKKVNSQVSHTFDITLNPSIKTIEELQLYLP